MPMKTTPHKCNCWILHVTDPAQRSRIERQIEIERRAGTRNGKLTKSATAIIHILSEQLRPCPGMEKGKQ